MERSNHAAERQGNIPYRALGPPVSLPLCVNRHMLSVAGRLQQSRHCFSDSVVVTSQDVASPGTRSRLPGLPASCHIKAPAPNPTPYQADGKAGLWTVTLWGMSV